MQGAVKFHGMCACLSAAEREGWTNYRTQWWWGPPGPRRSGNRCPPSHCPARAPALLLRYCAQHNSFLYQTHSGGAMCCFEYTVTGHVQVFWEKRIFNCIRACTRAHAHAAHEVHMHARAARYQHLDHIWQMPAVDRACNWLFNSCALHTNNKSVQLMHGSTDSEEKMREWSY